MCTVSSPDPNAIVYDNNPVLATFYLESGPLPIVELKTKFNNIIQKNDLEYTNEVHLGRILNIIRYIDII